MKILKKEAIGKTKLPLTMVSTMKKMNNVITIVPMKSGMYMGTFKEHTAYGFTRFEVIVQLLKYLSVKL